MADKPLFNLDAEGRWRLAYDSHQWVIQRRQQNPSVRRFKGHGMRESGWRAVSFVGGKKTTLGRLFREKGISLTPEAQARFDALPERFMDFVEVPASFAAQLEAKAA